MFTAGTSILFPMSYNRVGLDFRDYIQYTLTFEELATNNLIIVVHTVVLNISIIYDTSTYVGWQGAYVLIA